MITTRQMAQMSVIMFTASTLADAHLLAVKYLREGNPSTAFNLGSSTGFSNLQILEAARKVTGKEIPAELAERRPGDPDTLIASSDKAREVLGWKPNLMTLKKLLPQHGHGTQATQMDMMIGLKKLDEIIQLFCAKRG